MFFIKFFQGIKFITDKWKKIPTFTQLRSFEATIRLGNTIRAAQELNVSCSAISRQIKMLEANLGTQLFSRQGSGLQPTKEGIRFMEGVSSALNILEKSANIERQEKKEKTILISSTTSMANGWLVNAIQHYVSDNSSANITIETSRGLVDIDKHYMDIVIRYGKGQWGIYDLECVSDDYIVPVCSPKLLKHSKSKLSKVDDLLCFNLLEDLDPELNWDIWLHSYNLSRKKAQSDLFLHGSELCVDLARNNQGIALVRYSSVINHIRSKELIIPLNEMKIIPSSIWVGGGKNAIKNKDVRFLRNWLTRYLKDEMNSFSACHSFS